MADCAHLDYGPTCCSPLHVRWILRGCIALFVWLYLWMCVTWLALLVRHIESLGQMTWLIPCGSLRFIVTALNLGLLMRCILAKYRHTHPSTVHCSEGYFFYRFLKFDYVRHLLSTARNAGRQLRVLVSSANGDT